MALKAKMCVNGDNAFTLQSWWQLLLLDGHEFVIIVARMSLSRTSSTAKWFQESPLSMATAYRKCELC